jgi:hypothetical protein
MQSVKRRSSLGVVPWSAAFVLVAFGFTNSANAQDEYEDDDTAANATFIGINSFDQTHDFHDIGDVDWVFFWAEDGDFIEVETFCPVPVDPECDTYVELYAADDLVTPLVEADDRGGGDLSTYLTYNVTAPGQFFAKVYYSPDGGGSGFGPGTEFDLRVTTAEAPCVSCGTALTVQVSGASAGLLQGAGLRYGRDLGLQSTYAVDETPTNVNGVWTKCGLTAGISEAEAVDYLLEISLAGFATHVARVSMVECEDGVDDPDFNNLAVTLNKDNLATSNVDFAQSEFDEQDGSAGAPYRAVKDGIAAAAPDGFVSLMPGSSSETFAGGNPISKALTLLNANPGGGAVRIGDSAARFTPSPGSKSVSRVGFVRPSLDAQTIPPSYE